MCGSDLQSIEIEASTAWYDSKRVGYKEFDGVVNATYKNGSSLRIVNLVDAAGAITCKLGDKQFEIRESEGFYDGVSLVEGRVEFQSELTPDIVNQMLSQERGDFLPELSVSVRQHQCLFDAILRNDLLSRDIGDILPIT